MSDIMLELRNLAIPFGLLLAKNGLEHLKKSSTKSNSSKKPKADKPKAKKQSGGGCPCAAKPTRLAGGSSCGMSALPSMSPTIGGRARSRGGSAGMSSELSQLSTKLNAMIDSYMI